MLETLLAFAVDVILAFSLLVLIIAEYPAACSFAVKKRFRRSGKSSTTCEGVGTVVRRRFLSDDVPGHVLPLADLPGQHLL